MKTHLFLLSLCYSAWLQKDTLYNMLGLLEDPLKGFTASEILSYNPHTIQGAWTIVTTVIFSTFGLLLCLRFLAPIHDDGEISGVSRANHRSRQQLMESRQA